MFSKQWKTWTYTRAFQSLTETRYEIFVQEYLKTILPTYKTKNFACCISFSHKYKHKSANALWPLMAILTSNCKRHIFGMCNSQYVLCNRESRKIAWGSWTVNNSRSTKGHYDTGFSFIHVLTFDGITDWAHTSNGLKTTKSTSSMQKRGLYFFQIYVSVNDRLIFCFEI